MLLLLIPSTFLPRSMKIPFLIGFVCPRSVPPPIQSCLGIIGGSFDRVLPTTASFAVLINWLFLCMKAIFGRAGPVDWVTAVTGLRFCSTDDLGREQIRGFEPLLKRMIFFPLVSATKLVGKEEQEVNKLSLGFCTLST